MKRRSRSALIIALSVFMLIVSACGKSEFGATEITEKSMVISARNAGKDSYFMSGSIQAEEGDKITAAADLSKGEVKVEIYMETGEQSMDKLPELEDEPTLTGILHLTDSMSGTVPAGTYMVKATCLEKATGTVVIEVEPCE